jgi:uncharacterized protein
MQFDDQNVDVSGVQDRRGAAGLGGLGGGTIAFGGGGLGVVGLVVYLLVSVLGGGGNLSAVDVPDGTSVQGSGDRTASNAELSRRCNTDGAIDRYEDCYIIKVYDEINETWTEQFRRSGEAYHRPGLVFFTGATRTGCGAASSSVGPFYCPPDQTIYLDLGFLDQLQQQFGAQGRYAQAYIVAHEAGHHLQNLLGTERKVRAAQQQDPGSASRLSVSTELQADCYAGVWGRLANDAGHLSITERELDEAQRAAAAVGDDRIQQKVSGRVDPETWTHGSAQQRRSWYLTGYQSGDVGACDTFSSPTSSPTL